MVKAKTLEVSAGTVALGMAATKVGVVSVIVAAACITGTVASRHTFTADPALPRPTAVRLKRRNAALLDLLYGPGFQRPASIDKSSDTDGNGFAWTDRTDKGAAEPGANLAELLTAKPKLDHRAVILSAGHWLDVHFQKPIVDAPGPDIIVAGWTGSPRIAVIGDRSSAVTLEDPAELRDTWGRIVLGYDLAVLAQADSADTARNISAHRDGPLRGFELHKIRARQ